MIAVAELLKKERLPGNYFAPSAYVQGDFELGLIENRQGNRLIALPSTLLDSLYSSLEEEVGPAAGLVLFQCGKWWGKYFYRRFAEEVSAHYGQSLAEMEMVEFLQCVKQCWKTYGWGLLNLDFNYYEQGFILATVQNSAFAQVHQTKAPEQPSCYAEAGLLAAFLTQLTGQELHCVQTTCEAMGAPQNTFILGLAERVKIAEACLEEKQDHDTIMTRLGLLQPLPSDVAEVSETLSSVEPEQAPTDALDRVEESADGDEESVGVENTIDSFDLETISEPEVEAAVKAEAEIEMPEPEVSAQAEEILSIEDLEVPDQFELEIPEPEVSAQAEEILSIEDLEVPDPFEFEMPEPEASASIEALEVPDQFELEIPESEVSAQAEEILSIEDLEVPDQFELEIPESEVSAQAEETLSVESLNALDSLSELPNLDSLDLDDLADFSLEDADFSTEPA
jgi:uncharacterized protein